LVPGRVDLQRRRGRGGVRLDEGAQGEGDRVPVAHPVPLGDGVREGVRPGGAGDVDGPRGRVAADRHRPGGVGHPGAGVGHPSARPAQWRLRSVAPTAHRLSIACATASMPEVARWYGEPLRVRAGSSITTSGRIAGPATEYLWSPMYTTAKWVASLPEPLVVG